MRILTIAYHYPPIQGPESIQANRLIKYSMKLGLDFDIVTRTIGYGKKFSNRIETFGNIARAFSLDNFLIKGTLRVLGNDLEHLPDSERLWYPFAFDLAKKKVKQRKYDIIYSRSIPFSSHLVAYKLKKAFNLPWIAHFSDPWTDSLYINYKWNSTRTKNLTWEGNVVEYADRLVFTSEETACLIMKKYPPELMKKVSILPHSFDSVLSRKFNSNFFPSKEGKKIISYIGNFYGKRTPEDLFVAVADALQECPDLSENLRIDLYGRLPSKFKNVLLHSDINHIIKYYGEVTYMESLDKMAQSDVLLSIDAPSDESVFLPSKIIEYISYNKPIIAITAAKGTVSRLLRPNGHIIIPNGQCNLLKDTLIEIAYEGSDSFQINYTLRDQFTPEKIASHFYEIVKHVVQ